MLSSRRQDLIDLLSAIPGVRVYSNLAGSVEPPAVLVNLPSLSFEAYSDEPSGMEFEVVYLVKFDDRATDRLIDCVPLVVGALDGEFVVTSAEPTVVSDGGNDLPGYRFTVTA